MSKVLAGLFVGAALLALPSVAGAHCDALDGPVVKAARAALEQKDVAGVLAWVEPDREAEVRAAFDRTLAVRALGGDARALAETWFFETLVRIHRAGEGAPYDGLKPAGHIEPFALAVDRTLEVGTVDDLVKELSGHVSAEVRKRFALAQAARAHAAHSVEGGRHYVAAYVDYMHYVEALYKAGAHEAEGHAVTAAAGDRHPR
jgi:hypothetical protein